MARRNVFRTVEPGNIVALNPKESGYFDDSDKSGIVLTQFDPKKQSHKAEVPEGVDISRIRTAVAIGRLVVLSTMDEEPPAAIPKEASKMSATTRARMREMLVSKGPRPHDLLRQSESTLIRKTIPGITDPNLLEQMLQLEINGENPAEKPRVNVVDCLKKKIKEYAKVVAAVNAETDEELFNEEVEKEGAKDQEFLQTPEGKAAAKAGRGPKKNTQRG